MTEMFCPNCDEELKDTFEFCPNCGWKTTSDLNENGKEGVDNNDAISRMFNAANEKIGEELEKMAENPPDGPPEYHVIKGSGSLSDAQIEAFNSGQALEFLPGDEDMADFADFPITGGFPVAESKEIDTAPDEGGKKSKFFLTKLWRKVPAILRGILLTVLITAVSGALGVVGTVFYYENSYVNETYNTALSSVYAVAAREPGKFKTVAAYVRRGVQRTDCIIQAVLYADAADYEMTYYRLDIGNASVESTILYRAFDEEEYQRLKSGSDEDKIRAGIMKSYHDTYLSFIEEIKKGGFGWEEADAARINMELGE